jgi:hypothetical protein
MRQLSVPRLVRNLTIDLAVTSSIIEGEKKSPADSRLSPQLFVLFLKLRRNSI